MARSRLRRISGARKALLRSLVTSLSSMAASPPLKQRPKNFATWQTNDHSR